MHIVHICQQHQYTNCLRHLFVLQQFGVFKCRHVTRHNDITYSFNMHCMFHCSWPHSPTYTPVALHITKKNQHLLFLLQYYHASMLTLQNSSISHALWLPQAWYYGGLSVQRLILLYLFTSIKGKANPCHVTSLLVTVVLDYMFEKYFFGNWRKLLSWYHTPFYSLRHLWQTIRAVLKAPVLISWSTRFWKANDHESIFLLPLSYFQKPRYIERPTTTTSLAGVQSKLGKALALSGTHKFERPVTMIALFFLLNSH